MSRRLPALSSRQLIRVLELVRESSLAPTRAGILSHVPARSIPSKATIGPT